MDGIDQWVALQNGKSVKREHIIINIDEKIDAEGKLQVFLGTFSSFSPLVI